MEIVLLETWNMSNAAQSSTTCSVMPGGEVPPQSYKLGPPPSYRLSSAGGLGTFSTQVLTLAEANQKYQKASCRLRKN